MALKGPIVTDSFEAGMVRAVAPHLIPSRGAYSLQNLIIGDDGPAFRRGGTAAKSNANFGTTGLRMLWDGYLAGGQRTVFANSADFGVLASDDVTPVNVGGPGLTGPVRPAVIDGLLFMGASAYGGSRKTAGYSTGTIALTNGSTTVTGSGTSWTANVDAGMVLTIGSRLHAVKSVTDNTHLELYQAFTGSTASGQSYALDPVAAIPAAYNPGGSWVAAGNRLLSLLGDRVAMSAQFDSTSWDATDEWLLPGVQLLGGAAMDDRVMLFTTNGVWALSNLDYDLTDAAGNVQQSLRQVNADVVLWQEAGIATWENALIVPAVDGAWLVDGGRIESLTRSIAPLWRDYVARGYRLGRAAVFAGHYLMPILDSGTSPVDMLVCRLDRPVEMRPLGKVWPWTNWAGGAANVTALAARSSAGTTRLPLLLGADRSASGRVVSYPPFQPDGPKDDHDGATPIWEVVTRAFPLGELGTAKYLRVRYEMGPSVASIDAAYTTEARDGATTKTWGSFRWGEAPWQKPAGQTWTPMYGRETIDAATSPVAGNSDGSLPFTYRIGKRARFMQFRLRGVWATERTVLRSLELFVRASGRI